MQNKYLKKGASKKFHLFNYLEIKKTVYVGCLYKSTNNTVIKRILT